MVVTIGKYVTPHHLDINGNGIEPDFSNIPREILCYFICFIYLINGTLGLFYLILKPLSTYCGLGKFRVERGERISFYL